MAPTKNLRKNNRVKSKKRPIPKNNKRKTNKSKKRTSRNKRRTRRKQKGGMRTSVIVANTPGRFPTLSRKKKKIEPELQQTASPSIQKLEKKPFDPQNYPGYFHEEQLSPQEIAGFISPRQAEDYFTRQGYSSSFFLMPHSPGGPMHIRNYIKAGPGATLSR